MVGLGGRLLKCIFTETVFKFKAAELDRRFIDSVKNLFKDREIEISIKPVKDATEYLFSSPSNKKHFILNQGLPANENILFNCY